MKPYPSNIIIFNIDERILDNELKLALRRSWTHIGEILVRSHPATEDEAVNYIHVMVKFGTRKYLRSSDPESDENWTERMEQHLLATMRKISSNMIAFNRNQRNSGGTQLDVAFIEFELESGALTLEYWLDSNGALPTSCAHIATDVRNAFNEGLLENAVRIRIPSQTSYERQALAAAQKRAEEEAAAVEQAQAEAVAEQELHEAEEILAEELFMESPEMKAQITEEQDDQEAHSPLEVAPLTDEEWEARYGIPEARFEVDYRLWDIVDNNENTREFDSEARTFVG